MSGKPRSGGLQWLKSVFGHASFAPEVVATPAQWVEIVVISLATVALSWWAQPADPTLVGAGFPWQWLAPVLIALRYGVLPGLLASVVLVCNEGLAWKLGRIPGEFSAAPLFGGGLLVLVCGEFSDVWRDRNLRMEETYLYVTERLSRLTKRHLLLNLSHDRLEQEMLARPGSLRDALARLRALSMEPTLQGQTMPGADGLLQLLSLYVSIESATLYTLKAQGSQYALGELVASLGEPVTLVPDDELLLLALEKGGLAHIASQDISFKRQTAQLVVAPLIAGDNELVGVLAVSGMPFFSLNKENLQMLLVLLGYYADNFGSAAGVIALQQRLPTMPVLYAQELQKLIRLQQKLGVDSHVVVLRFEGPSQKEITTEFLRIKRGLDLYWLTYANDTPVIAVLLPFASAAAKDGFLLRVASWLHNRFQGDFVSLGIHPVVVDLDAPDPLEALARAVDGA